jgi:hypothetical protein
VRLWLCALVLALSGCAKGDEARHTETVNRMLSEHGTPDFEDASTAEYAAIQHTPSGMLCRVPADGAFEFDIFPSSSMNAGAQCSSAAENVVTAWVAVSFREPTTLDAAFASAVEQLTGTLSTQPWRGDPSEADRASPEGLPHYRIHRMRGDFDGDERYLRVSMAEQDGWYLQQIVSAPLAEATAAEAAAGVSWRAGLQAFTARRGEQPQAAP